MAQLIGLATIGRDAELRYLHNGDAVTNLSLAFNYGRKGEDGRRPTQWVDAALFGKRAESLANYLLKGQRIAVTIDDIHIETYQTRDGGQGSKLAGSISNIEFAGSPQQSEQQAPRQAQSQRQAPQQRQAAPQRQAPAPQQAQVGSGFSDMEDDVPF